MTLRLRTVAAALAAMATFVPLTSITALAEAAPGPGAATLAEPAGVEQGNFQAVADDRQTRTVEIGTNGTMELRTVSGDITVTAGSGSSASIEIIRQSRGRTDEDARRGLAEVQAQVDHQGTRASVHAVYPDGRRPYSVSITYVVTAPAGTRLSASSVSGDVTIRNVTGDLSVGSTSGDLHVTGAGQVSAAKSVSGDVTILGAEGNGPLSAGSVSGDVRIDRVRASTVEVQTVSGSVAVSDATAQRATLRSTSGDVTYSGTIAGSGRYEFTSHSGDVDVRTSGSPGFDLEANTFSGSVRTDPASLTGPSSTARRNGNARAVRGRVGNGSAVVVVTTFSGDATISAR